MTSIKLRVQGLAAYAFADGPLTKSAAGIIVTVEFDASWETVVPTVMARNSSMTKTMIACFENER